MEKPALFDRSFQVEAGAKGRDIGEASNLGPLKFGGFPAMYADGQFQLQTFANALPVSLFSHVQDGAQVPLDFTERREVNPAAEINPNFKSPFGTEALDFIRVCVSFAFAKNCSLGLQ